MDKKQQIRKNHILMRNRMPDSEVAVLSEEICGHLKEFFSRKKDLKKCGVYGYYPYGKEVALQNFYYWLLEQKVPLAFPRTDRETMEFYLVTSMKEFSMGAFHIMEPLEYCKRADFDHAVCLVPGSVFDHKGNRFGYGKGYYDRYFSIHKELYRMGIAYESQMEPVISAEKHDIKMQAAVTENGIHFFETEGNVWN